MLKRFSDILEIKNGRNQKAVENPAGKYPIYGSGGIMGYADDFICGADTVIIGRKGNINNPIYVEEPFWNVDTAFGLVANQDFLNPRYLYYFCKSFDFQKLNTTVTIPSLTKENLLKIQMEVPELDQQNSAVVNLQKTERLIDLYQQELRALDTLIKARFVEMFGTEKDVEKWPSCAVGDVADVCVGVVIKPTQYYTSNGIPAFRSLNVGEMTVKDENWIYFSEEGHQKNQKSVIRENDVLVVRSGAPGKACVANKKYAGYNAVDIIIAHPKEVVNPTFLAMFTNMPHGMNQIREKTGGAAQQHFNVGGYKKLKLILPPLELQNDFAAFVSEVDKSKFYEEACAVLARYTDNNRQEWMICQTLRS